MRTVTLRDVESIAVPLVAPRSTPKRNRFARIPRNELGASDSGSCVAWIRIGACSTETNPFAELETLHITICETEPATGAVVSSSAIPSRATLNAVSRIYCCGNGGRIVAETANEPFTLWACAARPATASTASIAASVRRASESECQRTDMTTLQGFRCSIRRRIASLRHPRSWGGQFSPSVRHAHA